MTIYFVLIFVVFFLNLAIKPQKSKRKKIAFIVISFLCMFVVSAFRGYTVGMDTDNYVLLFKHIDSVNFSRSRYEIGYLVFVKIIHAISHNPTVLLAVSSAICIGAVCIFIYFYSDDPAMSILLYIVLKPYFFQMTAMRQALATALIVSAFALIIEKRSLLRIVFSVALIVLSVLFHTMSVVVIIPYLFWLIISNERKNRITPRKTMKWTLIIGVIAFVFFSSIMSILNLFVSKYAGYSDSIWGKSNYFASLFILLIQLVFLAVGAYYCKNKDLEIKDRFAFVMIACAVVTTALSMRMTIWGRLASVFTIFTPLLFAPTFIMKARDDGNRTILRILIFIFSFAYMLITFIFRPEWDGVVPYSFVNFA